MIDPKFGFVKSAFSGSPAKSIIVSIIEKMKKTKSDFLLAFPTLVIKRDRNRMTFGTNFSLFIFGFRCG